MIDIQAILRLASTVACGIVLAAFAMWATDEAKAGSDQQIAAVAEGGGAVRAGDAPAALPAAQPEHGGVRGAVEKAGDALVSPFDHVGADSGTWPAHALPALLALLTYGLLGRILIAYLPR